MEGPPETLEELKQTCKQNKNQLEIFKEIMIRNKQSSKKKEEEAQEYAKKLSKFKSRAKHHRSRDSKEEMAAASSEDAAAKSSSEASLYGAENMDEVDDIRHAKTPKAKSSLLQKKLEEDRKMFEQRSKELTKSKREVEEKVEAIRQQLDEKSLNILESTMNPLLDSSQAVSSTMQMSHLQDKDNKIAELSNKVVELEAAVLDLEENLREKDSVIDSKTKAITLMSADLSKKGKTTLDTLEDTKDEMRTMQENFVFLEKSLKQKNDNLIEQLRDKSETIANMEETISNLEKRVEDEKVAETARVDFSRSTLDTLADTKEAMKSMQENFILIESSLKAKVDNLLQQLEEREVKLAEAAEKIRIFESGATIVVDPAADELRNKISELERSVHLLQDEKFELQKNVAEMQNQVLVSSKSDANDVVTEKDDKIAELENLIKELKEEEPQKQELQAQVENLSQTNEELANKVNDLQKLADDLESGKMKIEKAEDEDLVAQLRKELDDLNKNTIKLKAQHKSKVKGLQRQLDNIRKVSDKNAELIELGNKVAILEEEKGNLQLSLVDYDELKASLGNLKDQIIELEGKVSSQSQDIEVHIAAIATLESQKLDLTQEFLAAKQEISSLEAENADLENLRVTAEMKVVDLEEQLEGNKSQPDDAAQEDSTTVESLQEKINVLSQENAELLEKIAKLEEQKGLSDVGSTESFDTLHETDKHELMKRIDQLSQENRDLSLKLSRYEEKGSSDSGSSESFERISEHGETFSKVELLTRENSELVIKLVKLEEKFNDLTSAEESVAAHSAKVSDLEDRIQDLINKNEDLVIELEKLREKALPADQEKGESLESSILEQQEIIFQLQNEMAVLSQERHELIARIEELEKSLLEKEEPSQNTVVETLEREINEYNELIAQQKEFMEEMKMKLVEKEEESEKKSSQIAELESAGLNNAQLLQELQESLKAIDEWKSKCSEMEEKMQDLESGKASIESSFKALQDESNILIEESEQKDALVNSLQQEMSVMKESLVTVSRENASKDQEMSMLRETLDSKKEELASRYTQLQNEMIAIDSLQDELNQLKVEMTEKDANLLLLANEVQALAWKSDEQEESLKKALEDYNKVVKDLSEMDIYLKTMQNNLSESEVEIDVLSTRNKELEASSKLNEEKYIEGLEIIRRLEETMNQLNSAKDNAEKSWVDLQETLGAREKYAYELKVELDTSHEALEMLKVEHAKNLEMHSSKLDNILEELRDKTAENETLKFELQSKEGANVAEEIKTMMGLRIEELEKNLVASKEDLEAKIEKMKKFAVKLKKKTAQCEELESRLVELEQKWTSEKDEKEATNNKIQEVEGMLREKDSRITDLTEQMENEQRGKEEAVKAAEKLTLKLNELEKRMDDVLRSIKEMNGESVEDFLEKCRKQEHELDESKEVARELGVRMQVMEVEYVEQLSMIKTLQAENGMLSSKHAQLNEKLENVEKELEDKQILLDKVQKENARLESETQETQTLGTSQTQHCEHCEQCHNMVQELEAKLQERNTEIENLDNELSNSIGNFVQMQESLRYNNNMMMNPPPSEASTNLEEAYNELMVKYNTLCTANEEMQTKLGELLRENQVLQALQEELERSNALNSELENNLAVQANELERAREELQQRITEYQAREENPLFEVKEKETAPPLFDASKMFDATPELDSHHQEEIQQLRYQVTERDNQCSKLSADIAALSGQINEERQEAQRAQARLIDEIADLRTKLGTMTLEYNNLGAQLQRQLNAYPAADTEQVAQLNDAIAQKDVQIESLKVNLETVIKDLGNARDELNQTVENKDVSILKLENEKFNCESQLSQLTLEKQDLDMKLEGLNGEKEEWLDMQEAFKANILQLENKVRELNNTSRVEELEKRVHEGLRERELLQLQINDLHLTLENTRESSSSLSRTLQELQSELDETRRRKSELEQQLQNYPTCQAREEQVLEKRNVEPVESEKESASFEIRDEEEGWGWNTEDSAVLDIPIEEAHSLIPVNVESEMRAQISNLEQRIQNLETERTHLLEINKAIQAKCDKAIKKLMQKVKQEKLLQKKATDSFCDLDQAIEEELRSQIGILEKALKAAKEEQEKVISERESLLNRIDVLVAANERYVEMKERQDMEMEVYNIRNKELTGKVQALETQLQNASTPDQDPETLENRNAVSEDARSQPAMADLQNQIQKYKMEIENLQENMDALASENDQLQQLLEEQRSSRLKSNVESESAESAEKYAKLLDTFERLKEEHDLLRKQYENSLMDANDQVQAMREGNELLKNELAENAAKQESEINAVNESWNAEMAKLNEQLREVLEHREELFKRVENLTNVDASLAQVTELLNMRVQEVAGLKEERLRLEESHKEAIEDLHRQKVDLEMLAQRYSNSAEEQNVEIKQLKDRLNELELEKSKLAEDVGNYLQELKELRKEKESVSDASQASTVSVEETALLQKECEAELKKYSAELHHLKDLLFEEVSRRNIAIKETLGLKMDIIEEKCDEAYKSCKEALDRGTSEIGRLRELMKHDQEEMKVLGQLLRSESERFDLLITNLNAREESINELKKALLDKDGVIQNLNRVLAENQLVIDELKQEKKSEISESFSSVPLFTMSEDDDSGVGRLKAELISKQVEIDNLTFALNKNTYPKILQDLQDTINKLYTEKAELEMSLDSCREEIQRLKQHLSGQNQEKMVISNQEEIARLQNELHSKEQEMAELRFVINEKDAEIRALHESSSEAEVIESLNAELLAKHRQIESCQAQISALHERVASLKHLESLSEEKKISDDQLATEKAEKEEMSMALNRKNAEVENLMAQMQESVSSWHEQVQQLKVELTRAKDELSEKDRRLAELSIVKDADMHNLKVQLHDKEAYMEELLALSKEEEAQLAEMKGLLEKKETEFADLKQQLEEKVEELELLRSALNRRMSKTDEQTESGQIATTSSPESSEENSHSGELDLALYMLHQRDVRCEELTQELMQLLEERDTLQLRLSNAIRVNMELKATVDSVLQKNSMSSSEPPVSIGNPSPSTTEGPVEIAKEAIHAPTEEDNDALVENKGHAESVERVTELAVGEKYTEGSPHVTEDGQP